MSISSKYSINIKENDIENGDETLKTGKYNHTLSKLNDIIKDLNTKLEVTKLKLSNSQVILNYNIIENKRLRNDIIIEKTSIIYYETLFIIIITLIMVVVALHALSIFPKTV